ncbi:MAG: FHA domain-containing protein [Acidobacteriaceae bacterium]
MERQNLEPRWRINWVTPRFPWVKQGVRPAEVSDGLCRVITARENILEDALYNKVVPNHFKIEVTQRSYSLYFAPLEKSLIQQWRDRLLEHLMVANSRLGRVEYRLGGPLRITILPAADLKDYQARILCCVEPDLDFNAGNVRAPEKGRGDEVAFLELIDGDRRWPLYPGLNTIGRGEACDIFLDLPLVQEKRLISNQQAMIRIEGEQCLLLDGGLLGKPSANGTFVNSQRIPAHGTPIKEGDIIILAAIDPRYPRPDTPGVAAFRFRKRQ